jgi:hypothetical protein
MTTFLGILLAWLGSFAGSMLILARGWRGSPIQPEFWALAFGLGWPVLLLAWPVYLQLFKRANGPVWWKLPIIGSLLFPIPILLVMAADWAINSRLPGAEDIGADIWLAVWYALFGCLFGVWVGLTRRTQPLTLSQSG